jgi:hypothetical protein
VPGPDPDEGVAGFDLFFRGSALAEEYLGMEESQAKALAAAEGTSPVRIVHFPCNEAVGTDLRLGRLTLVVSDGLVVRAYLEGRHG